MPWEELEETYAPHPAPRLVPRGTGKVSVVFGLHVIAYNLIRLGNLLKPAMAPA